MPFKIGDRVVHPAYGTGQIVNVEEKRFSEKRATCISVQGIRKVMRELTAWGWRKPYKPDPYVHLAEDTAEPLSRMGNDG